MSEQAVTFVGVPAAMADLRDWAEDVDDTVNKASVKFVQGVADVVRDRVPQLTGQLAGSVETREADDGVELLMGAGLAYAGWIEFGGARGRPYIPEGRYLYPSAEAASDDFTETAEAAVDDSIARYSWSTPAP